MKAAVYARYGPPDVVRIDDIDRPTPKDDEVLVKVHVATVSRNDCHLRTAKPFFMRFFSGLTRPKIAVLGEEFAGVVAETGSSVTSFAVGDRVFGHSEGRFGAHAEYLRVPQDGPIATMPAAASFEAVAGGTDSSHYCLAAIDRAKIGKGHHVLVNGATGAMGSAAVQLIRSLGGTVTAVCGTDHVEMVRGLGADRVIDYEVEDFTKDGQRYDVVLDSVGKSSFRRCRRLLKPRGIYVSSELGFLWQNPILALLTAAIGGKRVVFPVPPRRDQNAIRRFKEMIGSGTFTPVIDRKYPLDQIVEAYRYVETGQKIGNVLITVDPAT